MDIALKTETGKFKFRVCGILKCGNKFLTVKMNDNKFYCLPGGHIELGEDTEQGVLREMQEELGYPVKIERLVAVNQNFFKSQDNYDFHELGFYYIVNAVDESLVNKNDYHREELDKGIIQQLDFKWFTVEELKKSDFRPRFLIDCFDKTEPLINITRD